MLSLGFVDEFKYQNIEEDMNEEDMNEVEYCVSQVKDRSFSGL